MIPVLRMGGDKKLTKLENHYKKKRRHFSQENSVDDEESR